MDESITTPDEVWRAIPKNEGYEVSSLGRVRSLDRLLADGRRCSGKVLSTWTAGAGYQYVSLGAKVKMGVHRLVAISFHGLPLGLRNEAAHTNGQSSDNRAENIVWATRSENEQHKRAHGTYARPVNYYKPGQKKRGTKPSRHPHADQIAKMRAGGMTIAKLAQEFGMSKSGMFEVLRNRC